MYYMKVCRCLIVTRVKQTSCRVVWLAGDWQLSIFQLVLLYWVLLQAELPQEWLLLFQERSVLHFQAHIDLHLGVNHLWRYL